MIKQTKPNTAELNDHESFQQTIVQLNKSVARTWRSAIAGITAALAAMLFAIFGNELAANRVDTRLIVDGFLFLIMAFNVYNVTQCALLRAVRDHLTEQLKKSVKQRVRADKFYGLSILDPLTGLHNRRFGEERLEEEIERAERTGDPLGVVLIDLDYFKEINDELGHAAGDVALKEFSRKLKRAIRACDVPVRMGGDEFLLVLPECPRERVELILSRLGSPEFEINARRFSIRYSVGRAQHQVNDTIKTMLERADEALYTAKAGRSKRVHRKPSGPLLVATGSQ